LSLTSALRRFRQRTQVGPLREPFATLRDLTARTLFGRNLELLSLIHGTDKDTLHRYAEHYTRHFAALRRRRLTLLEIGIGGYDHTRLGGESLRMWRSYFPRAQVYGIDIHDKSYHDGRRIKTFRGDQSDPEFLARVLAETGPPDIVIDDGSHVSRDVIASFDYLFPRMADTGIYVIEDTQTSYWPDWGGDDDHPDSVGTTMGYFKSLVHGLNHEERPSNQHMRPTQLPTHRDRNIRGISFYHNLVFIQKGLNWEGGRYRAALEHP